MKEFLADPSAGDRSRETSANPENADNRAVASASELQKVLSASQHSKKPPRDRA